MAGNARNTELGSNTTGLMVWLDTNGFAGPQLLEPRSALLRADVSTPLAGSAEAGRSVSLGCALRKERNSPAGDSEEISEESESEFPGG